MLTINMLGKVNITYNDESLDDKLNNKLIALICLLVLNMNRDMSKGKISSYLWPDSDDDAAKYNLRYNLWMINKLVPLDANGQHLIISGKDYCRINEKYCFHCDKCLLDQFDAREHKSVEELIKLKELFKGDFLEGLYLKNCNEFNEIILFERVVCQNKQVEILRELVNSYEEQNKYEEALHILNEMMVIEPYNESFAYGIMDLYGKLGNRAAGINYYKKFERALRGNLNISTNNELKRLYGSLLETPCQMKNEAKDQSTAIRKKIQVEGRCLKNVDYFWVADVIIQIMNTVDKKYMLELNKKYVFDLSFIQTELLLDYEKYISDEYENIGFVPSVRIINSFLKFLRHASDICDIDIKVKDFEDIDPVSLSVLKAVEQSGIENICLHY